MLPRPDPRHVVALTPPDKTDGSVVEVVCTGGRAFGHAPPGAPVRWYTVDAAGRWWLQASAGWVPATPSEPVRRAYADETPLTRVPDPAAIPPRAVLPAQNRRTPRHPVNPGAAGPVPPRCRRAAVPAAFRSC